MARFEKSSPKRSRPNAAVAPSRARRASTPPSIEDTMFFPRLRRHAKWMFVLLALFMGLGFVAFGVGAGGVGFGDVLRGIGGGGPSVSDAREKTEENSKDAAAWQELVTALQADGDVDGAIEAQRQVIALRPKDPDALRLLASLHLQVLREKQTEAQLAQTRAAYAGPSLAYPGFTANGRPVLQDPIDSIVGQRVTAELQAVYGEAQTAATGALDAYKQLAKLQPNDPGIRIEVARTALQTGDVAAAIAAYERFLELAPDDPSANAVRQQLKQLRRSVGTSG
jgi:tetratricopeptide (TPR) repeat protein